MASAKSEMTAGLGIIILRYGLYDIAGLAQDISQAGVKKDQVLIVHNQAADNDWKDVNDYGLNVHIMNRNAGYSGGVNEGIRHHLRSSVEVIGVLTHDVRLAPNCLQQLFHELRSNPKIGAVGPSVCFAVGEGTVVTYGGFDSVLTGTGHRQKALNLARSYPSEWIDGSVILMSRSAIESTGLFNENYFLYYEDAEWCLRCNRSGYVVAVMPGAVANQRPGGTSRGLAYTYLMTVQFY